MATTTESRLDTRARISRAVGESTEGAIEDLVVEIRPDEVLISGVSATYYLKQLATQAALASSGGLAVRNEIRVQPH